VTISIRYSPDRLGSVLPFTPGWRFVQRPVDRDVGDVQADHLVEGVDGFFDQALTRAGCLLFVTPASARCFAPFVEPSGHVPAAPGDQAKQDGLQRQPQSGWSRRAQMPSS